MSEFTQSGKRISSRHHISSKSREAEDTQVPEPTKLSPTATPMSAEHQRNPDTAAPARTPPPHHTNSNETPLATNHDSPTLPFHANLSPISSPKPPSTPLALDQLQQPTLTSGATNISHHDATKTKTDTALLINRISTLETDLQRERSTNIDLAATLSAERLTFEQRMLRMEQTVAALTAPSVIPPPLPPPPPIPKPTLTPAQLEKIAKNRQEAIRIRNSKLPTTPTRPRTPTPYRPLTTAPLTSSQKTIIANNKSLAIVNQKKHQNATLAASQPQEKTLIQPSPSIQLHPMPPPPSLPPVQPPYVRSTYALYHYQ